MSLPLVPHEAEIKAIEYMAKTAKDSKFFEKLGGVSGIASIMFYARELGVPLMQALCGGMHNIEGKIEISPRLMNSMIRKAGHQIHITQSDEKICKLKGVRKDTGETYECTYSMDDATKAGLANKHNWKSHPSDMLFARCLSRLARRLFADVIGESYVEGEIQASVAKKDPVEHEEKDEGTTIEVSEPSTQREALISEDQCALLDAYIMNDPEAESKIMAILNIDNIYNMPASAFNGIIKRLETRKNQRLVKGGQHVESSEMATVA